MKKTLAFLSALIFIFSLAACGKNEQGQTTGPEDLSDGLITDLSDEATSSDIETETGAPEVTEGVSETETETEPAEIKLPVSKEEILASYTAVVNKVKTDMPQYVSNDWQTVSNVNMKSLTYSLLSGVAGNFLEAKEKSTPDTHAAGKHAKWFALPTSEEGGKVGCVLTDTSKITAAKCVRDGDNFIITITLASEKDPYMNINNPKSVTSWHGRMFDVIDIGEVVEYAKKVPGLNPDNAYCTFQGTATLKYNPATNECIKLDHIIDVRIFLGSGAAKVIADYHFYDFNW